MFCCLNSCSVCDGLVVGGCVVVDGFVSLCLWCMGVECLELFSEWLFLMLFIVVCV